jgi:predicted GNAT family N-acyltransferase
MEIINSSITDLENIFSLFDSAIEYQKKKGFDLWPQFSKELIETEIKENRHWKIMEGGVIACIFSVIYDDPVIWVEKNVDPSVYLHRITINPLLKGKEIVTIIKDWALDHAKKNNKKYVRMDTWGNNENLKNYYEKCGFNYIGKQYLNKTEGLPAHYGGEYLSLFQNEVT